MDQHSSITEKIRCSFCGAMNPSFSKFCYKCGQPFFEKSSEIKIQTPQTFPKESIEIEKLEKEERAPLPIEEAGEIDYAEHYIESMKMFANLNKLFQGKSIEADIYEKLKQELLSFIEDIRKKLREQLCEVEEKLKELEKSKVDLNKSLEELVARQKIGMLNIKKYESEKTILQSKINELNLRASELRKKEKKLRDCITMDEIYIELTSYFKNLFELETAIGNLEKKTKDRFKALKQLRDNLLKQREAPEKASSILAEVKPEVTQSTAPIVERKLPREFSLAKTIRTKLFGRLYGPEIIRGETITFHSFEVKTMQVHLFKDDHFCARFRITKLQLVNPIFICLLKSEDFESLAGKNLSLNEVQSHAVAISSRNSIEYTATSEGEYFLILFNTTKSVITIMLEYEVSRS